MNRLVPLKSICTKITDGSHYSPIGGKKGFPMLSVKDMTDYGFSYDGCKYISKEEYEKLVKADCKPKLNDLLIAKDGSYLKHVFVVKNEIEQAILSSIGILRPNLEKVHPEYLKYYLQTKSVKETVSKKYVTGSALPRIILKAFGQIDVLMKDLPSQKSIAKILLDLDAKIELNYKTNQELEALAKTLYDYWFVQFDFPNEQGKPYKSSGGKMVFNKKLKRLIPADWNDGCFNDLGEVVGGSTPARNNPNYYTNNGIPWITPNDLSNNKGNKFISHGEFDITKEGLKDASLRILPKDSILLSSRAPVGYMAICRNDVTTNQGFKSFIPNKGYPFSFVYYSIKNSIKLIEKNASGSTFKEISGGVLKSLPTLLPSKKIIEDYASLIKSTFKKQNLIELENQKLTELRDWVLPMLMNGQLTVGEVKEELDIAAEQSEKYGA